MADEEITTDDQLPLGNPVLPGPHFCKQHNASYAYRCAACWENVSCSERGFQIVEEVKPKTRVRKK